MNFWNTNKFDSKDIYFRLRFGLAYAINDTKSESDLLFYTIYL